MVELCPRCNLRFEREEGHWLAAVVINMGFTQVIVVAYVVVALVLTWPDPPLVPVILTGVAFTALFGVLFMPFAKTIWQAIELWMRQWSREDLEDLDRSTYR